MNFPKVQGHQELQQAVSARELHDFLGITERFSSWFDRMLGYGFTKNQDYLGCEVYNKKARQTLQDYRITKSMASQICAKQRYSEGVGKAIESLGLEFNHIHTHTRFEISFIDMLEEALSEIDIEIKKTV